MLDLLDRLVGASIDLVRTYIIVDYCKYTNRIISPMLGRNTLRTIGRCPM